MKIRRRTIIRFLLSGLVLSGVAWGAYGYLYGRASDTVRTEILKVVDDMALSAEDRPVVRRSIEAAHSDAFTSALDLKKKRGLKFDGALYFRLVFDSVIADARRHGMTRLADSLERQREDFAFETRER